MGFFGIFRDFRDLFSLVLALFKIVRYFSGFCWIVLDFSIFSGIFDGIFRHFQRWFHVWQLGNAAPDFSKSNQPTTRTRTNGGISQLNQ